MLNRATYVGSTFCSKIALARFYENKNTINISIYVLDEIFLLYIIINSPVYYEWVFWSCCLHQKRSLKKTFMIIKIMFVVFIVRRLNIMDQVMQFVEPSRQFVKDSIRLVKRCTKPDRKGSFTSLSPSSPSFFLNILFH